MDSITIPDEALEAAAREVAEQLGDDWDDNVHTFCGDDFQMTPDGAKEACRAIARAACLAMMKHWPGMRVKAVLLADTVLLPLPQKETSE